MASSASVLRDAAKAGVPWGRSGAGSAQLGKTDLGYELGVSRGMVGSLGVSVVA